MTNNRNVTIVLALAAALASGCKPKATGSDVQSIVSLDANGNEIAALSLVPVRNFTVAKLADGAKDPGAQQAEAMVKARLFALVECNTVTGKSGKIKASELMSAVEMRAAIDDLYVDNKRRLMTSADDESLAKFGSDANKLVVVPCHVHGRRLLSWSAVMDIQVRALGLPKSLPASGAGHDAALETYRAMQAIHLSLRGSYMKDTQKDFMPRLPSMIDMMREQAGYDANVATLASRIRKADALYNPCDTRATAPSSIPYADQLRAVNYSCVAHGSIAGAFNYQAGGLGGADYAKVKDLIALEVEAAHNAVFPISDEHDKDLYALWDLLTTTQPWGDRDASVDVAKYLTTGAGLNFKDRFESKAADKPASDEPADYVTVNKIAAPLVAFVQKHPVRAVKILRATSTKTAGRSVLQGGQTSSADGLASTSKARVAILAKSMGPGGAVGLPNLGNSVVSALSLIREAP